MTRMVSKRRKIGLQESDLPGTSGTYNLEILEGDEKSSNIAGSKRKHNGKVADEATHDLVDQTESSIGKLKKQKGRCCKNGGESSTRVKVDLGTENGKVEPKDLISESYNLPETSGTDVLKIEGDEKSSNIVADEATHDLVDQTESSNGKLKKQYIGEGVKRLKVDLDTEDGKVEPKDLISELPDEILHKILSQIHCPKDVARLGTLSGRWRDIYSSSWILRLDQRKFSKDVVIKKGKFCVSLDEIQHTSAIFRDFVTRSLEKYVQQGRYIDILMLHMTIQDIKLTDCMDYWLKMADQSKVRELDIHFPTMKKNVNTDLFLSRHHANERLYSISTLESLKLYGCRLDNFDKTEIYLPQLKKICLGKLYINGWMIDNLTRCCPNIEHLGLIFCTGVKALRISGLSKLNKLEVHCCHKLTSIVVAAPNLQTFWLHGGKKIISKIDLASCLSLMALSLENSAINDEEFQHLFCSFPCLELLELIKCHSLNTITVSSLVLKKLVLRGYKDLAKTKIDAPNLSSFEFQGNKKPPLAWNPCGLKEAKVAFKISNKLKHPDRLRRADYYWFSKFRTFLRKLDASRGLKLLIRWKNGIIIHEDLTEILVPPNFDMSIEVIKSSKRCEDIIDYALSSWHPKTLTLVSSVHSRLPQVMLDNMNQHLHDSGASCCTYSIPNNKCWRHFLKDAKKGDSESLGENCCWISWINSNPTESQKTTNFSLSWIPKSKPKL